MKTKAQSSMEFLILMGFLTFVIIAIVGTGFYYSATINDRMRSTQVSNFATKIVETSELVFYSGEPSKSTIAVYLPDSVSDIYFTENSIVITYTLNSGQNVVAFQSNVPMLENSSAQISVTSGTKSISVVANETCSVVSQN